MVRLETTCKLFGLLILTSFIFGCSNDQVYLNSKSEFLIYSSLIQVERRLESNRTKIGRMYDGWMRLRDEKSGTEYSEYLASKITEVQLNLVGLRELEVSFEALYEKMVTTSSGADDFGIEIKPMAMVTPDSALFNSIMMLLTEMSISNSDFDFEPHPLILWRAKISNLQIELQSALYKPLQKDLDTFNNRVGYSFPSFFLTRSTSLEGSPDSINVTLEHHRIGRAKDSINVTQEHHHIGRAKNNNILVYINPPGKSYPLKNGIAEFKFDIEIPAQQKIDTLKINSTILLELPWGDTLFTNQFEYRIWYK